MPKDCLRILLVEDNLGDALLLEEMLAEADSLSFSLVHAGRLNEARELLLKERFDLILLDLSLPDSHGLHSFVQLYEETIDTPIVVLTGNDDDMLGQEAVQSGAQDFLVKGRVENYFLVRALRYAVTRHRMQAVMRAVSLEDELTGLCNRRGFLALTEQHLKLARRANESLLMIYLDLDGMKRINDTYGHHEGDLALIDTAAILKRTFRESDVIARLGGDEFIIAAIEAGPQNESKLLARLEQNVDLHNSASKRPYSIEMSVGVVRYTSQNQSTIGDLVAQADAAMYHKKRERKAARSVAA